MKRLKPVLFVSGAILLTLLACTAPDPIQIIITPTPDPDSITTTPLPTLEVSPVATSTQEMGPSLTPTPEVEVDDEEPTATRPFGPILPTDYRFETQPPPTVGIPTVTPTPDFPTRTPTQTVTPGPSPTPIPQLNPELMGIQLYSNMSYEQFEEVIRLAEVTGVGWVKIQVSWAFIQPEGPETFGERFQLLERQIELAARPGFGVLLSVAKAPEWARSNLNESGPPDNPQDLADFLSYMLNETKIGGVVDAIEIWNEPNLIREWTGQLSFNGAGYMQLFRPAYDTIRAFSQDMIIVTAGLAPTQHPTDAVDDRLFLQQMYDAGLRNYNDIVIGIHPYSWGNAPDDRCCQAEEGRGWDDNPRFFFRDNIEDMREIMIRNGHENSQMWATEFGWATWDGIDSDPPDQWISFNTAQDQANYALRAFEIAQRELPYMGVMFLWNLNFANNIAVEQRQEVTAYSIINPVVFPRERPLYWMLAQATEREENDN